MRGEQARAACGPFPAGAQEDTVNRGPVPTVDVIIEVEGKIVLVRRKYPPPGWAIPGGFIDQGERAEDAAIREAREETGLSVTLTALLGVYSDPARDLRRHTISTVYVAVAEGTPSGGDDASEARPFGEKDLPVPLAFDHANILADYFRFRKTGKRPL